MLGEEMSFGGCEVDRAVRWSGKGERCSLAAGVRISAELWPDASKRASRAAGLMRMRIGALVVLGAGVPARVTLRA